MGFQNYTCGNSEEHTVFCCDPNERQPASIRGNEIDLSLVKSSCQCQNYATCAWSTQVVNQMAVIPKNMPLWKSLFQSFMVQICDRKERHVWCCRDGEQARGSELEILNRKPDENNVI